MVDGPGERDAATRRAGPATGRRGYLRPGLIALGFLVAAALAFNFAGLQHRAPHTLQGSEVATLVAQAVQADRHLPRPPDVACPPSEPVRAGLTFTCRLTTAGGARRDVVVTETDNRARFSWRLTP